MFWQPRIDPTPDGDLSYSADPPFGTDERADAIAAEGRRERLLSYLADQQYDKIIARQRAQERVRQEREAYMASEEGTAEAAARFAPSVVRDLSDIEDPVSLIDGLLVMDSLARTVGPPKSYKSFVALHMAACVATGIPFYGRDVRRSRVLYVVAEGLRGMKMRKAAWESHWNEGESMGVEFHKGPVQLSDMDAVRDLIAYCSTPDEEGRPVEYLIFDTQARVTVGVDENDNTEMGTIVDALGVIQRKTGACIHLVHHTTKASSGDGRGAGSVDGAIDSGFVVERRKENEPEGCVLRTKFQKDIAYADPITLAAEEHEGSVVMVKDEVTAASAPAAKPDQWHGAYVPYVNVALDYDPVGCTMTDLSRDLGRDRSNATKTVARIVSAGFLRREGNKLHPTDKGRMGVLWSARQDAQEGTEEKGETDLSGVPI